MKWEYLRESVWSCGGKTLNKLGEKGWELVCCDSKGYYIFKRPIKDDAES